jgi:hypothetical protein
VRPPDTPHSLCAEKVASETTGDEWQADTVIWLDWAGMSGSKKGKNVGLRILLLGLLRSIVTCYYSWIKPEPFGQSWQAVIYTDTTCRRNSRV